MVDVVHPFAGLLGEQPDVPAVATAGTVVRRGRRPAAGARVRRRVARVKTAGERAGAAAYRARNRERLQAYARAYYERNREKLLAYGRQWRELRRDQGDRRQALTAEQLTERERARLKSYYWNNREKVLAKAAARRMAKKAAAAQKVVGHV